MFSCINYFDVLGLQSRFLYAPSLVWQSPDLTICKNQLKKLCVSNFDKDDDGYYKLIKNQKDLIADRRKVDGIRENQ